LSDPLALEALIPEKGVFNNVRIDEIRHRVIFAWIPEKQTAKRIEALKINETTTKLDQTHWVNGFIL
jgi:hypothetical protein